MPRRVLSRSISFVIVVNTLSVQGCEERCDIVLQSSDGYGIAAHKRNLEVFSESFPRADYDLDTNEPVPLAENRIVLHLLLQFMHNTTPPKLSKIDITAIDLVDLYKAAEKYGNYPATEEVGDEIKSRARNRTSPRYTMEMFLELNRAPIPDRLDFRIIQDYVARYTLSYSQREALSFFSEDEALYYYWSMYRFEYELWNVECLRRLQVLAENITHTIYVGPEQLVASGECPGGVQFAKHILAAIQRITEFPTIEDIDEAVRAAPTFDIQWGCTEAPPPIDDLDTSCQCDEQDTWRDGMKGILATQPLWQKMYT
uniref:BTB domain-containing protein n=1 Tax=Moniliophthora roreri TaxID=221103 RepID=A0A0W0G931_MONRR